MEAALTCFARDGFEATSLRELASIAGVDVALVARLFGSKAQLWTAVVEHLAQEQVVHLLRLQALAVGAVDDPAKAFEQLVMEFATVGLRIPQFPALLMHEGSIRGERLDLLLERLVTPFREASRPVIAAAIRSRVILSSDVDLCFGLLISAVAVPVASPYLFGQVGQDPKLLSDAIAKETLRLMMRSPNVEPVSQ